MPSLTVPNTKNIKTKNSCRRILTSTTPLSSTEISDAELKVKINIFLVVAFISSSSSLVSLFLMTKDKARMREEEKIIATKLVLQFTSFID